MINKIIGVALFIVVQQLLGAHTKAYSQGFAKNIQPYLGLSGGVEMLTGTRSETVFHPPSAPQTAVFSASVHMGSNKPQGSVFGGVSFNIPNMPIFIAPEIYFGHAGTAHSKRGFALETATGLNRTYQATFKHQYFTGIVIHMGLDLPKQFRAYMTAGVESSEYQYNALYTPRSAVDFGFVDDFPPVSFSKSKWLNGYQLGIGVEKTIHPSLRLGLDIRMIMLQTFRFSAQTQDPDVGLDTHNATFKPRNTRISVRLSYCF